MNVEAFAVRRAPGKAANRLDASSAPIRLKNASQRDAASALARVDLELNDVRLQLPAAQDWKLTVRGLPIEWMHDGRKLRVRGREAVLHPGKDTVSLRLVLDRTSLETFADDGLVQFSDCFLPPANDRKLRLEMAGPATVSGEIHAVRSAWRP